MDEVRELKSRISRLGIVQLHSAIFEDFFVEGKGGEPRIVKATTTPEILCQELSAQGDSTPELCAEQLLKMIEIMESPAKTIIAECSSCQGYIFDEHPHECSPELVS